MVKASLNVLSMYLIIFAPLILFAARNEGLYFIVYGASIALLNTLTCLGQTIRQDMEQRRLEKPKAKRG